MKMRPYLNKAMEELSAELSAGLLRLRKGYVDSAEALLRILDSSQDYPYEFIVFRVTGYRPYRSKAPGQAISGKALASDLLLLMLDVSASFPLEAGAYNEPACDLRSLARRLNVSTKTIQRWRREGLPARRLVFPDGKSRLGFLESSLRWFVRSRRGQVLRSVRFTQMSDEERQDVLRRARRMTGFTRCTLGEVAKRIAARTGRSVETVRYTIRRYDLDNPDSAVFAHHSPAIDDQERAVIYRCFLRGVSASVLAAQYRRTRGSIYRIINETRAKQLMERSIAFVYCPQFDLPGADDEILTAADPADEQADHAHVLPPRAKPPGEGSPAVESAAYFNDLSLTPLLTAQQERDLFRRYNYLKFKADKLRGQIDLEHVRTSLLRQVETLLLQASAVKNRIIRSNLRLVVSIARKHSTSGTQSLLELVSDGNLSLMHAVEKFDYSRGFRFSTYASWAIMRGFARTVPRERYMLDRMGQSQELEMDLAALQAYDPHEVSVSELRESIDSMLAHLTPRERTILIDHYGLDRQGETRTLEDLSRNLGLSKERVRQIEAGALDKLRRIVNTSEAGLTQ